MAQVMSLPVVYFCENNRYGEFTPYEDVTSGAILDRPRALGIEAEQIDGMDVFAVREAAARAVKRAREGGGPQFIESMTYRFVGHSRSDPAKYRREGELDEWRKRDPLLVARERLAEFHGVEASELDAIDAETATRLEQMKGEGLAAPMPDPELLLAASEFKP